MSFIISTDTSANLPTDMAREHELLVIPFTYIVEGQAYTCEDTSSFNGDAFYEMLGSTQVTTSMINGEQYRQAWEPLLMAGHDILHISMSSGISGAFETSRTVVEALRAEYPERTIVSLDTHAASLGEGMFVLRAIEMRKSGRKLKEVVQDLMLRRPALRQVFTVEDLMYLKRGGRLSGAVAVIGTVLKIKPILKGDEAGRIVIESKARGRRASLKYLVDAYVKEASHPEELACIAHCGCPDDARLLEDAIHAIAPEQEILTVYYEPVTGCHVGPGTVALFFWKD